MEEKFTAAKRAIANAERVIGTLSGDPEASWRYSRLDRLVSACHELKNLIGRPKDSSRGYRIEQAHQLLDQLTDAVISDLSYHPGRNSRVYAIAVGLLRDRRKQPEAAVERARIASETASEKARTAKDKRSKADALIASAAFVNAKAAAERAGVAAEVSIIEKRWQKAAAASSKADDELTKAKRIEADYYKERRKRAKRMDRQRQQADVVAETESPEQTVAEANQALKVLVPHIEAFEDSSELSELVRVRNALKRLLESGANKYAIADAMSLVADELQLILAETKHIFGTDSSVYAKACGVSPSQRRQRRQELKAARAEARAEQNTAQRLSTDRLEEQAESAEEKTDLWRGQLLRAQADLRKADKVCERTRVALEKAKVKAAELRVRAKEDDARIRRASIMAGIMADPVKLMAAGKRMGRKLTRAERADASASFEFGLAQSAYQRLCEKYFAAQRMVPEAKSPRVRSAREADLAKLKVEVGEAGARRVKVMRDGREAMQLRRELEKTLARFEKAYEAHERAAKKAEREWAAKMAEELARERDRKTPIKRTKAEQKRFNAELKKYEAWLLEEKAARRAKAAEARERKLARAENEAAWLEWRNRLELAAD